MQRGLPFRRGRSQRWASFGRLGTSSGTGGGGHRIYHCLTIHDSNVLVMRAYQTVARWCGRRHGKRYPSLVTCLLKDGVCDHLARQESPLVYEDSPSSIKHGRCERYLLCFRSIEHPGSGGVNSTCDQYDRSRNGLHLVRRCSVKRLREAGGGTTDQTYHDDNGRCP